MAKWMKSLILLMRPELIYRNLQSYDFPPFRQLLQNGNQPALSQDVTQRNNLDALGPQI